jgi:hypothetical protein
MFHCPLSIFCPMLHSEWPCKLLTKGKGRPAIVSVFRDVVHGNFLHCGVLACKSVTTVEVAQERVRGGEREKCYMI